MKSFFDNGFRSNFMPMPLRRPGLGQDESPIITSIDQGAPAEPVPGAITSIDQGGPAAPVPGLVTYQDLQSKQPATPSPGTATDWGKVLQEMAKAGATTYAGYTKDQIAQAAAKQKAGLPTGLPGLKVPPPSGINPNVVFVVGGLAAATLIAVLAAT